MDHELQPRVAGHEPRQEKRQKIRGYGGNDAQPEGSLHKALFFSHNFFHLAETIQRHTDLFYDLFANMGRHHRMPGPVKDPDIQLLLQLLDHHAQGWLGHETCVGSPGEMPVLIHCQDIFQLLNIHIINIIYANIENISLTYNYIFYIFAPSN